MNQEYNPVKVIMAGLIWTLVVGFSLTLIFNLLFVNQGNNYLVFLGVGVTVLLLSLSSFVIKFIATKSSSPRKRRTR